MSETFIAVLAFVGGIAIATCIMCVALAIHMGEEDRDEEQNEDNN